MAQTKKTKKFERDHLKDTIKRRKDFAKVKQRHALKAKKKSRRAVERGEDGDNDTQPQTSKVSSAQASKADLKDMDVDDFFQTDFDLKPDTSANGRKRKRGDLNGTPAKKPAVEQPESESDDEQDYEAHKQQMSNLAEKDPEFHKYLQENDPELLDLENADLGELSATDNEEDDESGSKRAKPGNDNEVTTALVTKWEKSLVEQHSLRASREVVVAFRAAAHASDEEEKNFKYSVSSPEAYHQLLVLALNRIPDVLQHHLPVKESASGKVRIATESKKYQNLAPLLKTYFTSLVYLLGFLSDALTLRMTLSAVETVLPYTLSLKKMVRDLAKAVVGIWSTSSHPDSVRLAAFLVLRRLIVIGDPSIREATLKAVYQGLVKGARNTTVHTLAGINLMKNSAAELWGLDPTIGYTTGFSFIRQLAVHLRTSITNNANESYKLVYNWQYVHSLDFWSRVLSTHCNTLTEAQKGSQSSLRPLIYPLVQVTLGALRLIPTAAYFPLRFHLTRSLLRLSSGTGTYIPLTASLYEVLTSAELRKPPKPTSLKPLDFATTLRAQAAYLGTRTYQDGLGEQLCELLSESLVLWSRSIAFPELALPAIVLLKRWLKEVSGPKPHGKSTPTQQQRGNKNGRINAAIGLVVQKIEANRRFIEERRAKVDFAPENRARVEAFLRDLDWSKTPLGAYVVGQRTVREEKAKVLEEARREEEERKTAERQERKREDREGKEGGFVDEEEEEDEDEEMVDAEDSEAEDDDEDGADGLDGAEEDNDDEGSVLEFD